LLLGSLLVPWWSGNLCVFVVQLCTGRFFERWQVENAQDEYAWASFLGACLGITVKCVGLVLLGVYAFQRGMRALPSLPAQT